MDPITTHRQNHRRGNYSMLMGATALIVVGFAAFSIDISLITMAELQAQATADAASHAALIAFRENLNTGEGNIAARFILDVNEVAMGVSDFDTDAFGAMTPLYGQWDFDVSPGTFTPGLVAGNANAAKVAVSRKGTNAVDLLLAPLLGVLTHDVDAVAVTAQQQRAIMLIQDMSCSMMPLVSPTDPNYPNSAVNISRIANLVFLDFLNFRPQKGDLLGLATFAQAAGNPPGPHPWGGGPLPWQPLVLVETNNDLIASRINGICDTTRPGPNDLGPPGPLGDNCIITDVPSPHCASADPFDPCRFDFVPAADIGGCTNPEPALVQAINQLETNADDGYFRGIVFMSDGVPNCDENGNFNQIDAINRANVAANEAESLGISIWTILFHNGTFDPAFMGCDPTDSDGDGQPDDPGLTRGIGFCQSSPNASDLPGMYRQVAESLPTAFVD